MKSLTSRPAPTRGPLFRLPVLGLLCGITLIVSCRPETKYKWLSTFFDGVPVPGAETNRSRLQADEEFDASFSTNVTGVRLIGQINTNFVSHRPYEEKNCTVCHESRFSVRMKGLQTEYCFACHDNFLAQAAVKHYPAENGECTSCHHPHAIGNPKLLRQVGAALCFECHDDFLAEVKVKHLPVESGECLSCHNPHASANAGLLIRPGPALCFECHENFLEQAAFTHAPAASGDCFLCHRAHGADHPGLLVQAEAQICLECHEAPEMARIQAHKEAGERACLDCHDPHGSVNRHLLKSETETPRETNPSGSPPGSTAP